MAPVLISAPYCSAMRREFIFIGAQFARIQSHFDIDQHGPPCCFTKLPNATFRYPRTDGGAVSFLLRSTIDLKNVKFTGWIT
jgi:hypothetical protein